MRLFFTFPAAPEHTAHQWSTSRGSFNAALLCAGCPLANIGCQDVGGAA
ncbi:unnamed protein product [Staurois parvus]|uniref:Uncharacterized protein n=1 Tax=Staurois parvus TaxID=386267 RepID=A0ABN9EJL3_9NEOB|nr:unnamed protein product [Staurois parvus]